MAQWSGNFGILAAPLECRIVWFDLKKMNHAVKLMLVFRNCFLIDGY
ncbi:hypothetical protein N826_32350 [Skermanella aerolata KACC 11604]|nr:hypothetical protein N826_32350 [Skermanella aerolata KACC 11604]